MLDLFTRKIMKKLTPEQIAEAISRLNSVELGQLGDELAVKELANKVAFLLEVAMHEQGLDEV